MHAYQALFVQLKKDFNIYNPEIDYLPTGKPFIKNNQIEFNISHSRNEIAIAISKRHKVGIDIEAYRPFSNITAAFSFFTAKEQQQIQRDKAPEKKLIDLWTKKEAVIKAIGSEMFSIAHKIDVTDNKIYWNNVYYYCYALNINIKGKGWMACTLSNYATEGINLCKILT